MRNIQAVVRRSLSGVLAGAALVTLGGCGALTRVTPDAHERQVAQFELMGLPYDAAVRKIEAAGFTCWTHLEHQLSVSAHAGVSTLTRTCNKKSFESFCPQRRYVQFEYTPDDKKVVYVRTPSRFEEHSCF